MARSWLDAVKLPSKKHQMSSRIARSLCERLSNLFTELPSNVGKKMTESADRAV